MGKYIPSVITEELTRFYVIPTIGIDWDPGVSYNIGIYVGAVSFQLLWHYGPPSLKLNNVKIVKSDITLSDFEVLMMEISKRDNKPNDKLLNARDRYMEHVMGGGYSDEYEVYLYNCDHNDVEAMDFERFKYSKRLTSYIENKHGELDTSWLDTINEGDKRWYNEKVISGKSYTWRGIPTLEGAVAEAFELNTRKAEYKSYLSNLANHMTFDQWLRDRNKKYES